jgi:hypothetical protein
MGILDFEAKNEAPKSGQTNGRTNGREDKPEAEWFLNFGYPAQTKSDDGEKVTTFVSLATVTTLDTIQEFDLSRINSPFMRNLRDAQNELRNDFMEEAIKLEPGESVILMTDDRTGLQVELRRRKAAQQAPVAGENPMRRKIRFSKPADDGMAAE